MTLPSKNRPAGVIFIFFTLLIDMLGFGVVIPVAPRLVQEVTGADVVRGSHIFGLLLASFGLMQFLFSPILGNLSDRYGRRPVLLLSLFFNVVNYVMTALAHSVGWLFAARIMAGITSASATVATAYIADITPPEKRAHAFGLTGAAFGIGFALGPTVGGLLGTLHLRAPFWVAAFLSLVNCLYGAFLVPESLAPDHRRPINPAELNPIRGLAILTRHHWVLWLSGAVLLLNIAQQALYSVWVLYLSYRFQWTPLDTGLSFTLIAVLIGIVQAGLLRVIVPKLGERRSVVVGMLFNIVGFVGFAFATKGWMMIAVMIVWSLNGIAGPTIQSLLSKQYTAREQGGVQGALNSIISMTSIAGPLIGTSIFGYFTSGAAPIHLPGAPFLFGAVLVVIACGMSVNAMRHHKDNDDLTALQAAEGDEEALDDLQAGQLNGRMH